MNKPLLWSIPALFLVLTAYLFASAPVPLPDTPDGKPPRTDARIAVREVLTLIAAENDAVRAMYTREIVGAGTKRGLTFSESWRDEAVHAGPLPALFLREAADSVQKSPVPLGLYLGSDKPIRSENRFEGLAAGYFEKIKVDGEPQFFYAEDLKRYTAMFADLAIAPACVSCHNEHPETPKNDWKLGDVMGATTWTYPNESVYFEELLQILATLREGYRDAYAKYLEEVNGFENPPEVGDKWPRDGYYLPSAESFSRAMEEHASPGTVRRLLELQLTAGREAGAPRSQ